MTPASQPYFKYIKKLIKYVYNKIFVVLHFYFKVKALCKNFQGFKLKKIRS